MAYKITDKCVSCGVCAAQCPMNSDGLCITEGEGKYVINPEICISCGSCKSVCPVEAPEEE